MEEYPNGPNRYMTARDFLEEGEDCPELEQMFVELEAEMDEYPLDEAQLRTQRDWSALANQVVGAEDFSE